MLTKDLLAVVSAASEENVFAASEVLAKRWDARLSFLHLAEGLEPTGARHSGHIWVQILQEMRADNASEFARIKERATRIKGVELRRAETSRAARSRLSCSDRGGPSCCCRPDGADKARPSVSG